MPSASVQRQGTRAASLAAAADFCSQTFATNRDSSSSTSTTTSLLREPLMPVTQSIDDLLIAAGGLGRYQFQQAVLNCGSFAICSASLLLPNLLYPRLREAWPSLTKAETASVSSIFFVGNLLGLAVWGSFGESYGRRKATIYSLALLLVVSPLSFAVSSVPGLAATRACVGFAVGGLLNAAFLLQVELAPPKERMKSKIILALAGWVVGALWVDLLAFMVRGASSWRLLALYLAPFVFLLLAAILFLEESARYLLVSGKHDAALSTLYEIGETNRNPLPASTRLQQPPPTSSDDGATLRRALELLHPTLRKRTALVGLAWFGSTCAYYGVALSGGDPLAGGDLYLTNALSALLEAPAYLVMACADTFGRRRTWAAFLIIAAIALMLLAAFSTIIPAPIATILMLVARFGSTGASAICYVAAAEQFPSSCRNLGVNYGAGCGRLGSILSPLMKLLPSPSAVLGGIGAIAALAVLALPETQGVQVPETVQAAAAPTSSSSTRAAGAIGSAFEEGGGVELDQSDDTTEGQRNDAGSLLGRGHVASDSKI